MDWYRTAQDSGSAQTATASYVDVDLYAYTRSGNLEKLDSSPWFMANTSGPVTAQVSETGGANSINARILATWDKTLADARCGVLVPTTLVALSTTQLLTATVVGPQWVKVQIIDGSGHGTARVILGQKRL